jgi:ABC-type branched-subunit amino acid transport system substrate-binding protein
VKGIIGQWEPALHTASAPIYAEAQLATVEPNRFSNFVELPESFDAAYQTLAGSPAGPQARQAYMATQHLLKAIEAASHQSRLPERVNVLEALEGLDQN